MTTKRGFDLSDPEERSWSEFWGNNYISWLPKNPDNVTGGHFAKVCILMDKARERYENVYDANNPESSSDEYMTYLRAQELAKAVGRAISMSLVEVIE